MRADGMPADIDLLGRLALASLLAAAIGLERQLSEEAAGLRTHLLVGLGSCIFSLMAAYGLPSGANLVVAAQVVSGIGFLGAGAILRSGWGVRGLATAASLWLCAAVGMAAAFDHALIATSATVFALGTLALAKRLEFGILFPLRGRVLTVTVVCPATTDVSALLGEVRRTGSLVRGLDVDERGTDRAVRLVVEIPNGGDPGVPLAVIARAGSVVKAEWTQ